MSSSDSYSEYFVPTTGENKENIPPASKPDKKKSAKQPKAVEKKPDGVKKPAKQPKKHLVKNVAEMAHSLAVGRPL